MFILSSVSRGLGLWSENYTSMYENSQLIVFKNIRFLGEVSSNLRTDLLRINVYKTFGSCW